MKKWSKIAWGIIFTRKLGGETKSLKGNEEKELFTLTMYVYATLEVKSNYV